ncbi:hypothetical protein, partial [Paenibacillus whitsoniae]|uniref:hypothetical protein n=1 Tax=Paenibacillus whitsoniae TaxID=2496558 RepID=UPI0019CFCAB7
NWNFSRTFTHFRPNRRAELEFFQSIFLFGSHSPEAAETNWRFSSSVGTVAVSKRNELEMFQSMDTPSCSTCLMPSGSRRYTAHNLLP